jgi:hypothetical protein
MIGRMPARRWPKAGRAAVLVILVVGAWAAVAGAADRAAIDRIVQAVIHDDGIQTRSPLSGEPEQATLTLPAWVKAVARAVGYILLALLAIGGVVLLGSGAVATVRRRATRRPAAVLTPVADPPVPAVEAPDADETERLARGRDFSAAIHLLLRLAIDRLERHRGAVLPRCLTSREVLARARPPGKAGDALAGLVAAVEASHFGGAVTDEATWRRCRDDYRLIAAAAP